LRTTAWRIAWAFALLGGLPGSAPAQTPPPAPEACAALRSDAARLQCYDAALGREPAQASSADNAARPERAHPVPARQSLLDRRWELAGPSKLGTFRLRAYKPIYIFPFSWTSDTNTVPHSPNPRNTVTAPQDLDRVEAKFQLSMKFKLAENLFGDNGDVWGAYTQSSRWQVYNAANSRPFRESNYEPELMLLFRTDYGIAGWRGRMAGLVLNHQSNGQANPLSRSWNRVMLLLGWDRPGWALLVRPWRRVTEGSDDDNPDISDYLGRGDILLVHARNGHELSVLARHSLRGGGRSHGAVRFDWAFPIRGPLRGRLQLFRGYGESMIDYNHLATWVSAGFSLVEWF
jgi:phospholipase A1/A2